MKNQDPLILAALTLRLVALTLAAWLVVAMVYSASARATTPQVYCESAFGNISVHKGRCPYGTKFIGVKG